MIRIMNNFNNNIINNQMKYKNNMLKIYKNIN